MAASFRLFAAGLLLILTVPRMTQPGMFSDGVVYASIARNMAEGKGTFWAPEYTRTVYPVFVDHPPLGLGLESLVFRLAGDHPYVERLYSLLAGILTAVLIAVLWRRTTGDPRRDWLPLLFWILPSFVTWGIVNNMLDTTQAVFTTAAVIAAVTAMEGSALMAGTLAGVGVAAAVMTKGPVGLFPLAIPILYALIVNRRARVRAAVVTGVMIGVVVIAGITLWQYGPARAYVRSYVDVQFLPSLAGEREAAASPWQFAKFFGVEIVARMAGLLLIGWAVRRAVKARPTGVSSGCADLHGPRLAFFFLCAGLAASLPIAISPKVMGHYLIPAVPMFAMACALSLRPMASHNVSGDTPLREPGDTALRGPGDTLSRGPLWSAYIVGGLGALLIVAALVLPFVRTLEERDVPRLGAIDLLGPALHHGEIVRTCPEARTDWPLHAYLQRFLHVSMDWTPTPRPTFLRLLDRPCDVPKECVLVRFAGDLEMYACSLGPG